VKVEKETDRKARLRDIRARLLTVDWDEAPGEN